MIKTGNTSSIPLPWHRHCPACGEDNAVPIYLNRMAPIADIDMSYRVCRCIECGFSYAADLPKADTYTDYYQTLSKYDVVDSAIDIPAHDKIRIRTAVELCQPHICANTIITDIGCGFGALLEGFRFAGYSNIHGIDPAPDAHLLAKKLFGIADIQTGFLKDAEHLLPLKNTGLLCLTGVLEHLPRLYEDVERILRHLPITAKVFIEVPALEHFTQTGMEPFGEFSLEHVQYFSKDSLKRFMSRFGFSPAFQSIVEIPGLATDSLFSLFVRGNTNTNESPPLETEIGLSSYVLHSEALLESALSRITSVIPERFLVYGAGSHTARLIPKLSQFGLEERIMGVIDSNRNLYGKRIGNHTIHSPQFLEQCRGLPVLISSHNAQQAIARQLHSKHPLLLMYP
jgi:SAM-dependent methyltransferase